MEGKDVPIPERTPADTKCPPQENGLSVAAIGFAFVFWPLGAVFGHLARRRARYAAGAGAGLAILALIVSYSLGFATFLWLVAYLGQGTSKLT